MNLKDAQRLVKSKQRVADHGEVFTPAWMVEDMLDLVKHESERIDSRVLEPACGSGNHPLDRRAAIAVPKSAATIWPRCSTRSWVSATMTSGRERPARFSP